MLNYISYYFDKVITAYRLGIVSILRVIVYKILVRYRLHKVVQLEDYPSLGIELSGSCIPEGYDFEHFRFFNKKSSRLFQSTQEPLSETLFLTNWFNGYVYSNKKRWFEIGDFDSNAGDIKGVWELSRWYWAIEIASDMSLSREHKCDLLDGFISLWNYQNPYLCGPNWKCGQEAALRLTHFLVAMRLLGYNPNDLNPSQTQFVIKHLIRIEPTLSYAKGQKNNHWISEAVGLVIGGLWLKGEKYETTYYNRGIKELREAIDVLFNDDGSFAQSSFNYLRHALTLIAIVRLEIFQNGNDCSIFETKKLKNALYLFDQFCEASSTTTHNWGANDGSNPIAISQNPFLDPLAHQCFFDFSFKGLTTETTNNVVGCMIKTYTQYARLPQNKFFNNRGFVGDNRKYGFTEFPDGGLIFFRNERYRVLVRLPNFNFKPSQDDVGHLDVIYNGIGCTLDGGTFSYFTDDSTFEYFQGVHSHNTLYRASEKYSMSKLSRFVFGSWTKGNWSIVGENSLIVNFKNVFSDRFERSFVFEKDRIVVRDTVISSVKSNFVSSLTLNSKSLDILSENSGVKIKVETESNSESSDIFMITANSSATISNVPVSLCYGEQVTKKRVEFPINNQEVKFEICFKQ